MPLISYESGNHAVRRQRKRLINLSIAVFAAAFIAFAFIWEACNNSLPDEYAGDSPPGQRSLFQVQQELSELYWIYSELLPVNPYSRPGTWIYEVNSIVIHYVANPGTTAMQNRNYFANLAQWGYRFASSNFIIGLHGEIVQCVPVYEIAFASNHRNNDSISIEHSHPDESGRFTPETYESSVRLTALLCYMLDLTSYDVIRHYDVIGKLCPIYFVENEHAWEQFRADVAAAIEELREMSGNTNE